MNSGPGPNDDPAALTEQLRDAAEKNATTLRGCEIPIALEPPTVFRP